MMTLFCLPIDPKLLASYAKDFNRNELELSPILSLEKLGKNDFLLAKIEDVKQASFIPANTVILFSTKTSDESSKKLLKDLCEAQRIFGYIDTDLEPVFARPLFNRLGEVASQRQSLLRLAGLGQELDQLTEQTKKEITKIKQLHEKIIPVRHELHKGLTIHSKYAAGSSGGGEFFDFHHQNGEFIFLLSSSTSYLMTSAIITRLEVLKAEGLSTPNIHQLMVGILDDAAQLEVKPRGKRNALDLTVIHVDLKRMILTGHTFGDGMIVSKDNFQQHIPRDLPRCSQFIDKASFNFPLKRGEKLVFLSAGVHYNCQGELAGLPTSKFIQQSLDSTPKELLNELFFQLKKDMQGDFLDYDASAISIEVDKNAIFQI